MYLIAVVVIFGSLWLFWWGVLALLKNTVGSLIHVHRFYTEATVAIETVQHQHGR